MTEKDKTLKNNELTKLIGRRLREAVGRGDGERLPAAISERLAALRSVEARLSTAGSTIIDIDNGSTTEAPSGGRGGRIS